MRRTVLPCLALCAVLTVAGHARAQPAGAEGSTPVSDDDVARQAQTVARATMSPFCPGKTIDSCPSPRAQAWREDIRIWVAQGVAHEEIHARLQTRAPDFDLAGRPGAAWDWALPAGSLLLATLWLVLLVRRVKPRRDPTDVALPDGSDEWDLRLDRELDRSSRSR